MDETAANLKIRVENKLCSKENKATNDISLI
jgi:hypothetical protein